MSVNDNFQMAAAGTGVGLDLLQTQLVTQTSAQNWKELQVQDWSLG